MPSSEKNDRAVTTYEDGTSLHKVENAIDGVDPIYAAKAQVLNQAVRFIHEHMCSVLSCRFKTSGWADISGSYSSL